MKKRTFGEVSGEILAKLLKMGSGDGTRIEVGVVLGRCIAEERFVRICAIV